MNGVNEKIDSGHESHENLDEVLKDLAKENVLLMHQTSELNAGKILASSVFVNDGFIEGTCALTNPAKIKEVVDEMAVPFKERTTRNVHKSSNSIVILTIPNSLADLIRADNPYGKIKERTIDDFLFGMLDQGKLKEPGLPTGFVYGYVYNGILVRNPNYNPTFEN